MEILCTKNEQKVKSSKIFFVNSIRDELQWGQQKDHALCKKIITENFKPETQVFTMLMKYG